MGAARRVEAKGKVSRRVREPYAWLGVGALTLGMGAALAGAGVASADSTPSEASASASSSASSARSAGSASRGDAARPARARSAAVRTASAAANASSTAPASSAIPAGAATSTARATRTVSSRVRLAAAPRAAVFAGAPIPAARLEAENFGPVLGALVRLAHEIQYVTADQDPTVKPFQMPSSVTQTEVVGTLNATTINGDPVNFTVLDQSPNGSVTITANGNYTFTPADPLTAGAAEFTVVVSDAGNHPLADLLRQDPHSTQVTVPVTWSAAQPNASSPSVFNYTVYNTSLHTMELTYYTRTSLQQPAVGQTIGTGESWQFAVAAGATTDFYFTYCETATSCPTPNYSGNVNEPAVSGSFWDGGITFGGYGGISSDGAQYVLMDVIKGPGTYAWSGLSSVQYSDYNGSPYGYCTSGNCTIYIEDAPGTSFTVPSTEAQAQSDVLQGLVKDDTSNATFYTKSAAFTAYSNPISVSGFSPFTNNTTSPATNAYAATVATAEADSTSWNVSVKQTSEVKLGTLTEKAELGYQYTSGTTLTTTQTYSQTVTATVQAGEELFIYMVSPVSRFYGDWSVLYGNTTYYLTDVWYNTPYKANSSLYPSYISAFTCNTAATCTQLADGDLTAYAFTGFPASSVLPVDVTGTAVTKL